MENNNRNSSAEILEVNMRESLRKAQKDANDRRATARVMIHCAVMQMGFWGGLPALAPLGTVLTVLFGAFSVIARWGASHSNEQAFRFAQEVWDAKLRISKTPEEEIRRLQRENRELLKDRRSLTSQQLKSFGYAAVQYMLLVPKVVESVRAFIAQPSMMTAAATVAYGGVALVTAGGFGDFFNKIPHKIGIRRRIKRNNYKIKSTRQFIIEREKERMRVAHPDFNRDSVRIITINIPKVVDVPNDEKIVGAPVGNGEKGSQCKNKGPSHRR